MKPDFQISIPNPCHADWDKMEPAKMGKHCNACNKTVVDFTQMSDQQIKDYFSTNKQKVCGHFYKGQLNLNKNGIQSYLTDLYCNAYLNLKNKAFRLCALLILSCLLSVAGCNTPTQGEITERSERLTGDSISPQMVDSLMKDTLGKNIQAP